MRSAGHYFGTVTLLAFRARLAVGGNFRFHQPDGFRRFDAFDHRPRRVRDNGCQFDNRRLVLIDRYDLRRDRACRDLLGKGARYRPGYEVADVDNADGTG
tara:strand:- start:4532 stop:4831 length:300 start_codon:yes stop_codon:yes gene_type:complete